ncbi:MAG TPA: Stk1 family PASTA domain-containing Ser/Thr kinase [Candidatus Tyrphobacter sp.]
MIEQQTFNNRYRLDRSLGEGGMARVFLGIDTLLRRRVAIKVLREQYAADDEFVRRFYQEAESAAKLSHPNIVNTYDVGREGDLYYIVMELVDGPSLAEIIAADQKLPEPVAIDYAVQICTGLAYAHRQGLLHRDIKPANILVTKDDVVKLSDFGIARAISQHTMTLTKPGLVMGSIYYVSPEQAQGHEMHEASDLYSVGVVLYQMLTGTLPYTGESPVTVALKHIADPVPTIETGNLGVSPALAAIVNKLLQKLPEHRFGSASEVASALREARERPSVAAYRIENDAPGHPGALLELPPRRSKMPDRSRDEEQPRRAGSNVAMLVVALAAATAIGFWVFGRPLPDFGATLAVGNYVGESDAQAEQQAVNDGLRTQIFHSTSDTVPLAHVIRQNPAAGTKVAKNSVVELFISNGLPTLGLRDVRGFSEGDAQRILQDDKFRVRLMQKYDNAPKNSVIDEHPSAGSRVREGSTITLIVSNGPEPMLLPNFVGMPVDRAQAIAARLGVTLDTSQQVVIPGQPSNTIASQDPGAGQSIVHGAVVRVAVNTFSPVVQPNAGAAVVPSVAGSSYADAVAKLQQAGFEVYVQYSVQPAANGTVIGEQPDGGAQVAAGSRVAITLSVPGEVPDTVGMGVEQARAVLQAAGYSIASIRYTTEEGASGRVVGTEPIAGTTLSPGSSLVLVVNGSQP